MTLKCTLKYTRTHTCVCIHFTPVGEYIRRLENIACHSLQNILWIFFLQCMNWSIAGLSVGIWAGYCAGIIWTDSHAGSQTGQQVSWPVSRSPSIWRRVKESSCYIFEAMLFCFFLFYRLQKTKKKTPWYQCGFFYDHKCVFIRCNGDTHAPKTTA